jgi:hypothetical protein
LTVVVTTYPRIVNRRAYAAALLVGGALVAQAGLASPAFAAAVRYAAPGGSGTACTAAAPCSLDTAFQLSLANSDEIVVNPGTYTTASSGLSSSTSNLKVHGVAGQPRPVINSSAATALNLSGAGTTLSDLTINHTGSTWGINIFAPNISVQRLEVRSAGFASCELAVSGVSGLVRDTLCVNTGAGGVALEDSWGATAGATESGQLNLRNVTAVATGAGSFGIRAEATSTASRTVTNLTIDAQNVIASGTQADVRATRASTASTSRVTMSNSNYDTTSTFNGGIVTTAGSGTNQTAAPIYLETTTYRQAMGSPTIDKGATYTGIGVTDLNGDPRVTGSAPDIGVDELDVTPPDTVFTHTPKRKIHKRSATFAFAAAEPVTFICKVDKRAPAPCVSPYKVKVKKRGKHHVTVTATDTVGNTDASPAVFEWKYKPKRHKKKHHHHH